MKYSLCKGPQWFYFFHSFDNHSVGFGTTTARNETVARVNSLASILVAFTDKLASIMHNNNVINLMITRLSKGLP